MINPKFLDIDLPPTKASEYRRRCIALFFCDYHFRALKYMLSSNHIDQKNFWSCWYSSSTSSGKNRSITYLTKRSKWQFSLQNIREYGPKADICTILTIWPSIHVKVVLCLTWNVEFHLREVRMGPKEQKHIFFCYICDIIWSVLLSSLLPTQ